MCACSSRLQELFYSTGDLQSIPIHDYRLRIVKVFPEYDIAILESDEDLCNSPFLSETTFNLVIGQHLFYIGYEVAESDATTKALKANNAHIVNILEKEYDPILKVKIIEFEGVAVPGYSGGPVINDNNKVVAIITEAYEIAIPPRSFRINRASSIIGIVDLYCGAT